MFGGWQQVAFSKELEDDVTPLSLADRRLMLVRSNGRVRAYDATCPHRGAHLGFGGRLDGDVVVCPFHGRRIGLGADVPGPYHVAAHPTLEVGGLVFVLFDLRMDRGFSAFLTKLTRTHGFVPGFRLQAPVGPEWIIENVFDADHFHTVHKIARRPEMTASVTEQGGLEVEALFETVNAHVWQEGDPAAGPIRTRFFARVFSPGLCLSELGDPQRPQVVITAATPLPDGGCDIRVSLVLPLDGGGAPDGELVLTLMRDSRTAFEQDMEIWAHLDTDAPANLEADEQPVREFRAFLARSSLP